MSAKKRRSEDRQLSKEDYNALEESNNSETAIGGSPEKGGTFERAPAAASLHRRIVTARRPIAPPPAASAPATTVNPFAGVDLTRGAPGAHLASLARSAAAAAAPSQFSLSTAPLPALKKEKNFCAESVRVYQALRDEISKLDSTDTKCSNWSTVSRRLGKHVDVIQQEWRKKHPDVSPAAAAAPSAQAPSLNFGNFASFPVPAPVLTFAPAPAAGGGDAEDVDANGQADDNDDENDKVLPQPANDPDWDDVQEFGKVRMYRLNDPKNASSSWVAFCEGNLRLQTHKTNSTARMVLRDESGTKLRVNMLIDPKMNFAHSLKMTKAGKTQGQIQFCGVNDNDRGYESFIVRSNVQTSQALYTKFKELAGTNDGGSS